MLYYNLNAIFKARQIERPYSFLVKIGISPNTATKILSNNTQTIKLEYIEKMCEHLCCEPNDLFVYKPSPNHLLQSNHPLLKLVKQEMDLEWLENLKNMPLSDLKQMSKLIENNK